MVSPLIVNEADVSAAVITFLTPQLSPYAAFDADTLQRMGTTPQTYVEVSVSRRLADAPKRVGDWAGTNSFRVLTLAVAANRANAMNLRALVRRAFDTAFLPCAGATTPVTFVTEQLIAPDEGLWSGRTEWSLTY
jgi:hypothetical protein